jgi:hypothetical protein
LPVRQIRTEIPRMIFDRISLVFTGHWEDKHVYELPSIFALF